jgi:hypothetical protein
MTARGILPALAACLVGAAAAFAADLNAGTWKLDSAKSTFSPGAPKNDTVVVEVVGGSMKVTVDGTDGAGKKVRSEWTGKFDGKDYPVKGDPASDARSYLQVNDHTLQLTLKKGGKVTTTGLIVVAQDGKSRTVKTSGMDPQGKMVHSTAIYDRQ